MLRSAILFAAICLAACGAQPTAPGSGERPMRIVSLDYCADQYVLKFVDRDRILAVSPDADKSFSYMRQAGEGVAQVRPLVEDVLLRKPDLVVRSYGGGPGATAVFERAGVPVLNVGYAGDIEGIRRVTQAMADGLGAPEEGRAVIAGFDARLANLAAEASGRSALYVTPAGVTSGPGSLVHEMLVAAGLTNFEQAPGWRSLPLERLAYEQPDLVAAAFFDSHSNHTDAWSVMRHPVARAQTRGRPTVALQGAWTSCGAWFLIDAIEPLAEGARHDD